MVGAGIKFRFAPVPGMAAARRDERFAALLADLSVAFMLTCFSPVTDHHLDLSFLAEANGGVTARASQQTAHPKKTAALPVQRPPGRYLARRAVGNLLVNAAADWFGVKVDLALFKNRRHVRPCAEWYRLLLALIAAR